MSGIRIRHRTARSTIVLVPILTKPMSGASVDVCPGCKLSRGVEDIHLVKTVHLWLDDTGACIVSEGVLEDLRSAGMPELDTLEEIVNPPPLQIGMQREQQDFNGRAFNIGGRYA